MEKWIKIKNSKNYFVSNLGNVKRVGKTKEWLLKQSKHSKGYLSVFIYYNDCSKRKFVHRLVAEAFINGTDQSVNHKNKIKTDNRVENLEWVSLEENNQHASKLNKDQVLKMVELRKTGMKFKDIANIFNVHKTTVSTICYGHNWSNITGIRA